MAQNSVNTGYENLHFAAGACEQPVSMQSRNLHIFLAPAEAEGDYHTCMKCLVTKYNQSDQPL